MAASLAARLAAVAALASAGCNALLGNGDFTGPTPDACSGIGCKVADCASRGLPPTSLSGTVTSPDGLLPLSGAAVYVPTAPLDALGDGPASRPCASGAPITVARTDITGHFKLDRVPSVDNLPVVIQVGKWRRELVVPAIRECDDFALSPDQTRLPRNSVEGHLPRIAVAMGNADTLECIARSIGISDSEITRSDGTGRVQLYAGPGAITMVGTAATEPVDALYDRMMQYDQMMFSCDGRAIMRPPTAPAAMKAFVDAGGWVWLEHFHANWIAAPSPFPEIATFNLNATTPPSPFTGVIDASTPRGTQFNQWMNLVAATSAPGQLQITEGRNTCIGTTALAERLIYLDPAVSGGLSGVQLLSWSTPAGGRLWFSDIHFKQPTGSATAFPTECFDIPLSPQGRAIAYQMFDQPTCMP